MKTLNNTLTNLPTLNGNGYPVQLNGYTSSDYGVT